MANHVNELISVLSSNLRLVSNLDITLKENYESYAARLNNLLRTINGPEQKIRQARLEREYSSNDEDAISKCSQSYNHHLQQDFSSAGVNDTDLLQKAALMDESSLFLREKNPWGVTNSINILLQGHKELIGMLEEQKN